MIDGQLLENTRLGEVADTHKPQHALKVMRIKPKATPHNAAQPDAARQAAGASGPTAGARNNPPRIKFREVTLRKASPTDRIGVLFHRVEAGFDMSAFGKFDGNRPIIKNVRGDRRERACARYPPYPRENRRRLSCCVRAQVDPDTVGSRAGLQPGDVVLAVNGLSGQTNFQVVELIRTLEGEITFLVAAAPVQQAAAPGQRAAAPAQRTAAPAQRSAAPVQRAAT
jgi:hypothetical protein